MFGVGHYIVKVICVSSLSSSSTLFFLMTSTWKLLNAFQLFSLFWFLFKLFQIIIFIIPFKDRSSLGYFYFCNFQVSFFLFYSTRFLRSHLCFDKCRYFYLYSLFMSYCLICSPNLTIIFNSLLWFPNLTSPFIFGSGTVFSPDTCVRVSNISW